VNRGAAVVGVVLLCAVAVLAAALEILLVPLRVGTVMLPLSVLFAVVGNVLLARAARVFSQRMSAAVAPFVAWLVPTVVLALAPRPEGDVLVPGSGGEQWVFYALLLGGTLTGTVTLVLSAGPLGGAVRRPVQGS